ncbi:NADH:flavin oxidoreductase [Paenibacillus filicis]|uniref:NADH:flavin oxidoreductase n=1 Tax=Paenibacillus filicis TaxID=669464 RepID=A0ABU9DD02_9BACL
MALYLHEPLRIGNVQLRNRLALAPMQQYQGDADGHATDYHPRHYGERSSAVGLVIVESTSVAPDGRLFVNDIGAFRDSHTEPLGRIVDAIHAGGAHAFIQLAHGGRKALPVPGHELLAPSAIPFGEGYPTPKAMTEDDIADTVQHFRDAAVRSVEAGFDGIELHMAHGYLFHQFLSPLTNRRTDAYGGSPDNRSRFAQRVLQAIREAVGPTYPLQIRISSTDHADGGITAADTADALRRFAPYLDAVHVTTGGLTPDRPSDLDPGYQLPYAAYLKAGTSLPVLAAGGIHTRTLAERAIRDGLADIIAIGRPLQADPVFAHRLLEPNPASVLRT